MVNRQSALQIAIPPELSAFCQKWRIAEVALFGSALGSDFHAESDVDLLISPMVGVTYTLDDLMRIEAELEAMFGRRVDVGLRQMVERDPNYLRRRAIMESAQVIYAR